jgi:hypothetical protein
MMNPAVQMDQMTPSAQRAIRWAVAAAAHRTGRSADPVLPPIDPFDLLVGILLAHPDEDGEARVLLDHFGLTARDVVPPTYPSLSGEDLQRGADHVPPSMDPELLPDTEAVFTTLASTNSATDRPIALYQLLGALLQAKTALTKPLAAALAVAGDSLDAVAGSYHEWMGTHPADNGRFAGASLREWLRAHNARHPVDVPVYASDSIDARQDLIGIGVEADAFAYLLASCDLRPPLAIGLFGDWGSGKSFLMRSIQDRVRDLQDLVTDFDQAEAPVWKKIEQIEFNAWEYVQGDLWVALLERIFTRLGTQKPPDTLVTLARAPLRAEENTELGRATAAEVVIKELEGEKSERTEDLAVARKAVAEAAAQVRADTQALLDKHGKRAVRDALGKVWAEQRIQLLGQEGANLIDAVTEAQTELRRGTVLLGPYWRNPWRILAVTLAAAMIPLTAYGLSKWVGEYPLVSLLGGLAAFLPLITVLLRSATNWTSARLGELEQAAAEIRANVERDVAAKAAEVEKAEQALADVEDRLQAEKARSEESARRASVLRQQINAITPTAALVEYADKRSSDYRRRLGLLSIVRQDLDRIQADLNANNTALRSAVEPVRGPSAPDRDLPNRIVLYIDDLDRCPPNKVVEVLEAVHLLLAFEMFVVVVAVDTRWLESALTVQLPALTDNDHDGSRPTPRDYMEKIFQLPYWAQPLTPHASTALVRGLLALAGRPPASGRPHGNGGADLHVGEKEHGVLKEMLGRRGAALRLEASQLSLSPEDVRFMESLAPLVGDTPRRVKRFVNTCQLLLAMRPPLAPAGPFPSERHVVCLLAAINAGPADVADEVFAEAGRAVTAVHDAGVRTLGDLTGGPPEPDRDSWTALRAWLEENDEWRSVPMRRLGVRLDMVKRLRFQPPARTVRTGLPQRQTGGMAAAGVRPGLP